VNKAYGKEVVTVVFSRLGEPMLDSSNSPCLRSSCTIDMYYRHVLSLQHCRYGGSEYAQTATVGTAAKPQIVQVYGATTHQEGDDDGAYEC
jgi:hypothetical protein